MAKTFKQLMEEARKDVPELSVHEAQELLGKNGTYALLDVREKDEYREGHLEGAISLPRGFLEIKVESTVRDKSTPILATAPAACAPCWPARSSKRWGITMSLRCPAATPRDIEVTL